MSTLFRCRAAIWDYGPALYFRDCDLPGFEKHGMGINGGVGISLRVVCDRIVLEQDAESRSHLCLPREGDSGEWDFMATSVSEYEARCCLHEVNAEWGADGRLYVPIAPPHMLPYPAIKFRTDEACKALVLRDLRARIASATRVNGHPRIHVDESFQQMLTPRERVTLFTEWRI